MRAFQGFQPQKNGSIPQLDYPLRTLIQQMCSCMLESSFIEEEVYLALAVFWGGGSRPG